MISPLDALPSIPSVFSVAILDRGLHGFRLTSQALARCIRAWITSCSAWIPITLWTVRTQIGGLFSALRQATLPPTRSHTVAAAATVSCGLCLGWRWCHCLCPGSHSYKLSNPAGLLGLADELLLKILHAAGAPAVGRAATLCRRLRHAQQQLAALPAFASAAVLDSGK